MATKLNSPRYVIAPGDEGVQFNHGTRLAVAGSGVKVPGFEQIAQILKSLIKKPLYIVATAQNAWIKEQFELPDWEQTNATFQQQVQALADQLDFSYAGYLPFADPKEVKASIKGHMVRPPGIHLANKICFTLGGGEHTYNLGQYLISADWVAKADLDLVEKAIKAQVEFYRQLAGKDLEIIYQEDGILGQELAAKNKAILKKLGF